MNLLSLQEVTDFIPNHFNAQISLLNTTAFSRIITCVTGMFDKKNPDFPIGTICFSNFLRGAFNSCMIGYKLDKDYTKKGYMTEALNFLLHEVCFDYPLHRIEAYVMPDNTSSIRLLNKLGFKQEGYLHEFAKINNSWEDHFCTPTLTDESNIQMPRIHP